MKHLIIPDTQIRPGVCINHLVALGRYIVKKKPEVIVQLGDFADMHSLSTYDTGTMRAEGARLVEDIAAAKQAMKALLSPLWDYNLKRQLHKKALYKPRLILTLGNHEQRIERHVNANPNLAGFLSYSSLGYSDFGWEVYNFLEVVEVDGILYSHFFPRNATGRIVQSTRGSPNARVQVQREGKSCTSGHLQGLDVHIQQRSNRRDYGLIAGSFYMHEEDYLTPQGTAYWRGVVMKNEVDDGEYDPMFISLNYLLRTYGKDGIDYYA